MHEYQLTRQNCYPLDQCDMTQGTKMMQTNKARYFVVPNFFLMPYSLLSVVQHYQLAKFDEAID